MRREIFFFFFQAEDGIRDYKVTGVQTCALPISAEARAAAARQYLYVCGFRAKCGGNPVVEQVASAVEDAGIAISLRGSHAATNAKALPILELRDEDVIRSAGRRVHVDRFDCPI